MNFQRTIQIICLTLFFLLLAGAAFRFTGWLPHDLFLRLDPAAALLTGLAARIWLGGFLAALAVLAATFVLGRFFCGYLCPLGTTIDGVGACIRKPAHRPEDISAKWRWTKYGVLVFSTAAALMGLSLAFLVAPIPVATRFFAVIVLPLLQQTADLLLQLVVPLADGLNLPGLVYLQLPLPRFDRQWLTLFLMLLILAGGRWVPRFWCRCLCPAGALMALCAWRPMIRRRVTDGCNDCGLCSRKCPMNAIGDDPRATRHRECVACQTCRRVCPTSAVVFSGRSATNAPGSQDFSPYRRGLLLAGACGFGTTAVTLSGARHLLGDNGTRRSLPPDLIRPPGARPEDGFLRRCYRCGACLEACPTNTLQPYGMAAGLPGLLTPVVTPQLGPCDPACNVCGQICPTQAIRPLSHAERIWAKVGTAHILRHKCLAWELDRKCLVCDEVCPYDAIVLNRVPEVKVAVPFVIENRCSGCGFCEHHCPVEALPAIVVEPMEALRLAEGSYRQKGRSIGLALELRRQGSRAENGQTSLPLNEGETGAGLPPGFSE
jgi:ferredoxin